MKTIKPMVAWGMILAVCFSCTFISEVSAQPFDSSSAETAIRYIEKFKSDLNKFLIALAKKSDLPYGLRSPYLKLKKIPSDRTVTIKFRGGEFNKFSYIDAEHVYIGLPNRLRDIKGYILQQEVDKLQLRLQLLQLQAADSSAVQDMEAKLKIAKAKLKKLAEEPPVD